MPPHTYRSAEARDGQYWSSSPPCPTPRNWADWMGPELLSPPQASSSSGGAGKSPALWPWRPLPLTSATSADMTTSTASECVGSQRVCGRLVCTQVASGAWAAGGCVGGRCACEWLPVCGWLVGAWAASVHGCGMGPGGGGLTYYNTCTVVCREGSIGPDMVENIQSMRTHEVDPGPHPGPRWPIYPSSLEILTLHSHPRPPAPPEVPATAHTSFVGILACILAFIF